MVQNREEIFKDADILDSIEFDLSEAIKDLIYNIKIIKQDIEKLKKKAK